MAELLVNNAGIAPKVGADVLEADFDEVAVSKSVASARQSPMK